MRARHTRLLVATLLLAVAAALIAARRPDAFRRAQFWAEDGMVWYARAHNDHTGLAGLFEPWGGYLQFFPRLVALVAQLADLSRAPLLVNTLALLVQAIAPLLLLSDRFARAVPGRGHRLLLALVLIAVPNMMEVYANVTNSQVHLALLAFMVLVADPAPSRAFDASCLVLSGLSGPFCVILLPIGVLCWLRARDPWSRTRLLILLATVVIQAAVLSQIGRAHRGAVLRLEYDASFANLLDLLGRQIVVAGLGGLWNYVTLHHGLFAAYPWLPVLIGVLGLALVVRAFLVTRSFALRMLILFAGMHFAAALSSPVIFGDEPLWDLLKQPAAGQRYYYFATLAFLATVLWTAAADPRRVLRGIGAALVAVLVLVGIRGDWRLPPHPDLGFAAQAARFAAAAPGEKVELRITPEPWVMVLVKR